MANPICLSPLKFYDTLGKQERFKTYAYGHVAPLIALADVVPAFQLVASGSLVSAVLKSISGAPDIDITSILAGESYTVGGTVFQYLGHFPTTSVRIEGEYYLDLNLGGTHYYSEVMCFMHDVEKCLEIEYWNPEQDFELKNGKVSFANGFRFKVYLQTELGKPEYAFDEEATQRYGYTFIESQVSKKVYKFSAILPEYMCDALRLVRLCSHKVIRSLGEEYDALTFGMEPNWQEQGDLASVNFEFDVDNIIVNFGGLEQVAPAEDFDKGYNDDYLSESL